ncbi:MAG: fructose-bisphosphatase class III [Spirochaetes bacterium]|nr:fructose-bisphosphatase class III [Spirochaetota bacterium]
MSVAKTIASLHDLIKELTEIETELESNIETTLWISDPHGAGERFVSILKGRFGLVWRACYEALPKTVSNDKIEHLGRIIRKEKYFTTDEITLERQDVISDLVKIIQYKINDIKYFERVRFSINKDLKQILENLILNFPVPNIVFEDTLIADRVITSLSKIVKQVILGQIIVLGDVFDRGDEPDKILRILNKWDIKPIIKYVWGNHDILWMGAAAGNRSLIAEALRISVRYDNLDFLKRLGIDITNLKKFAEKLYPGEITGNFKAKIDISKKMEKTLAIIQFKLEEKTIKANPEFQMQPRLNLDNLTDLLKAKKLDGLTDTDFPTLDLDNPTKLTDEEKQVIDDLVIQFTKSSRIKSLMKFLFDHGKLYHINNYILNIHALIPCTEDGKFDSFLGKKGKELFDYIQDKVKNIGANYLEDKEQDSGELDLMFYLWCGPKSPFFGKHAMKTFERYFYKDKNTHKERLLFWKENIQKPSFMDLIMKEFGAQRIVYGHTPVDILKGEKIASPDGRAINIDGGFSEAYLSRGHSLIHTPYSLHAVILPTPDEILEARKKKEPAKLMIEPIDSFENPMKIKDTYRGKFLQKKRDELYSLLESYTIGNHLKNNNHN